MPETYISYNGRCLPLKGFGLPPSNRAFHYGDGVFETMRVQDGALLWHKRHFDRLCRSAAMLQMILPERFDAATMRDQVLELYRMNHLEGGAARVRFSLFRGDGGLYTPVSNKTSYTIESDGIAGPGYRFNDEGLKVDIYPDLGKPLGAISNLKTSSALLFVMASLYKARKNLDDCLILNQQGAVSEATSSNVFLVKGPELSTPGLDQACVDGVMRSVILDLAVRVGMRVREAPLHLVHLKEADELFLTNTVSGIRWVRRFRHTTYGNQVAASLGRELWETVIREKAKG